MHGETETLNVSYQLNVCGSKIPSKCIYIYINKGPTIVSLTEEWVVTPTKQVCIKLMVIRVE